MTQLRDRIALGITGAVGLAAFVWPLLGTAVPSDARATLPIVALALAPVAIVVGALLLDRHPMSQKTVAMLGVLSAVGTAVRFASSGVGGFEAVFIVLIIGGRAFGAKFGFLLGMVTIVLSTALTGTIGPWTAFQMFAAGWVGAGAGLLPRRNSVALDRVERRRELAWLIGYGIVASYLFGAIMNLWFWPFAVGPQTAVSYLADGSLGENLRRFGTYTLVTSTLTWDSVRALTSAIGIALIGGPALAALRRAKL
ncbi:MAG TPA: ECF transporter S component [Microbacteriaceae bacterium]|nr:ECF transporter S component [Microbacteriaceae bacterium]